MEIKQLPRGVKKIINRLINTALLKYFKVNYGEKLCINGVLEFGGHGKISIGDNVTINSGKEYNRIGGDTRTLIIALNNGFVTIGSNVGISNTALVSHGAGIVIEEDVFIGGGCKIYDTDHHSISYEDRMTAPDCNVKNGLRHYKKRCIYWRSLYHIKRCYYRGKECRRGWFSCY